MNEELLKLFDAVSAKYDIGDYTSFQNKMQTPEQRKSFFDAVSVKGYDLGDYGEYEGRLGGAKLSKVQAGVDAFTDVRNKPYLYQEIPQINLEKTVERYVNLPEEEKTVKVKQKTPTKETTKEVVGQYLQGERQKYLPEPPKTKEQLDFEKQQKKVKEGFLGEAEWALAYGADLAGQYLFETPRGLGRLSAAAMNKIASSLGYGDQRFHPDPLGTGYMANTAEMFAKKIEWLNQIAGVKPEMSEGVVSPVKEGKYGRAAKNLVLDLLKSTPSSLAMMIPTTSGASTLGSFGAISVMSGAQFADENLRNPDLKDLPEHQKVITGFLNGFPEGLFETLLGSGAVAGAFMDVLQKKGLKEGQKEIQKGIAGWIRKMYAKTPLVAESAGNGIEEIATQFSQNFVDKYVLGMDISMDQGVWDSGILGFTQGGGMGLTTKLVDVSLRQRQKAKQLQKIDQAEKDITSKISGLINKQSGQVVIAKDNKGKEYNIIDEIDEKSIAVIDSETGERLMLAKKDLEITETLAPEELKERVMSQFLQAMTEQNLQQASQEIEAEKPPFEIGQAINYNGQNLLIDQVENDFVIATPEGGDPVADGVQIPVEELLKTQPQAQPAIQQPKTSKIKAGNLELIAQKNEDGSFFIPFTDSKSIDKTVKDLEKEVDTDKFKVTPIVEEVPIEGVAEFARVKTQKVAKGIKIEPIQDLFTQKPVIKQAQKPKKEITYLDSAIEVLKDSQGFDDFRSQISDDEWNEVNKKYNPDKKLSDQETFDAALNDVMGEPVKVGKPKPVEIKKEEIKAEPIKEDENLRLALDKIKGAKNFTEILGRLSPEEWATINNAFNPDKKLSNQETFEIAIKNVPKEKPVIKNESKQEKKKVEKEPVKKELTTEQKKKQEEIQAKINKAQDEKREKKVPKRIKAVLASDANSIYEAILQYFVRGGKVNTEQIKKHCKGGEKEKNTKAFLFGKKNGKSIDVVYEEFQNTFGAEDLPGFDFPQMVLDVIDDNSSIWSMVEKLEALQNGEPLPVEARKTQDEIVNNEIENIADGYQEFPELVPVIDEFKDDSGKINWDAIQDKLNNDPKWFTHFPFGLTDEQVNELKNIINDETRRKDFEREGAKDSQEDIRPEAVISEDALGEAEKPAEIEPEPPEKSELYQQAESIIDHAPKGRILADLQDIVSKSNNIDDLKELLDLPYVKTNMDLPKDINGRIQYLERHEEKQEKPESIPETPQKEGKEEIKQPEAPPVNPAITQANILKSIVEQEKKLSDVESKINQYKADPKRKQELRQAELAKEAIQNELVSLTNKFDGNLLSESQQSQIRKAVSEYLTQRDVLNNRLESHKADRRAKEKELQKRNELTGDRKAEEEKKAGIQDLFGDKSTFKPTAENLQNALKPFNESIAKTEKEITERDNLINKQIESIAKGEQKEIKFETKEEAGQVLLRDIESTADRIKALENRLNTIDNEFEKTDIRNVLKKGASIKAIDDAGLGYITFELGTLMPVKTKDIIPKPLQTEKKKDEGVLYKVGTVNVIEDTDLTADRRFKVDKHIVEYRDEQGNEYRKSFSVKRGEDPIIPESGTHEELNKLKDQVRKKPEENKPVEKKTEFTFMADNPMGQGKALAALSKSTKYQDKIMKIYEFVESLDPGLKIETAKIHSSKSEKGYTEKLVIGDHIVFYKAEQDYYTYLQNGGMSYSEYLKQKAEEKRIQDEKDNEKRAKEREERAKSQQQQQREFRAVQNAIYEKILSGEISREQFIKENTQRLSEAINQLENRKQTTEVKRQLMVDKSNLEVRIKSLGDQYDLVKKLYKLEGDQVVNKYDYKVGDDVIVTAWNKNTPTKIESLRENPDGSTTYIVEKKDDIPNQYVGYESLEPLKPKFAGELLKPEEKPVEKIQTEWGEKIGGARKDLYKAFTDRLQNITEDDYKDKPFSEIFPEPDYKALVDEGIITAKEAAIIKFIRAEVAKAKPRKSYRLKRWTDQAKDVVSIAEAIITGKKIDGIKVSDKILMPKEDTGPVVGLGDNTTKALNMYVDTMIALGFPQSNLNPGNLEIKHFPYVTSGKPYSILRGRWIIENFKTFEDAVAGLKFMLENKKQDERAVKLDMWSLRSDKEKVIYIGKKVGPGKYITLNNEKPFKDVKEAKAFLNANYEELIKELEQKKEIPPERPDNPQERTGEGYRNGKDITPDEFGNTFGFRGFEFGNWVENDKRQKDLNDAYDALMDLANVLNIPPKALSLNGQLGIAFGARGTGGKDPASAHYEPNKVVINLTKKWGAGSLAHEWWHAVDNYFSRMRNKSGEYLTERPRALIDKELKPDTSVRPEMIQAFKDIADAINKSGIPVRSAKLDAVKSKDYWTQMREMAARSFESFVKHELDNKGIQNDYLVSFKDIVNYIVQSAADEGRYPYPTKEESATIDQAFKDFFNAVQTKEQGGKVAMFRRSAISEGNRMISRIDAHLIDIIMQVNDKGYNIVYDNGAFITKDGAEIETPEELKSLVTEYDDLMFFKNNVRFRRGGDLGLYSNSEAALDKIGQNKGTPEQWKAMILNNGGSQKELDWINWDEFVKDKTSLTKDEIAEFVKSNKVELFETRLGEQEIQKPEDLPKELQNIIDAYEQSAADRDDVDKLAESLGYGISYATMPEDSVDSVYKKGSEPTRYYGWRAIEGGENYREFILRMPEAVINDDYLALVDRIDTLLDKQKKGEITEVETNELHDKLRIQNTTYKDVDTRGLKRKLEKARGDFKVKNYTHSHWPGITNPVVHIRADERVTPDGKKILLVQEFQSDWQQQGRKQGFKTPIATREQVARELYNKEYNALNNEEKNSVDFELEGRQTINKGFVPDMPFKSTEQWVKLAFRRMLVYASENGFDGIAWTTGEQQVEQNKLSKHIESVMLDRDGVLYAHEKGGDRYKHIASNVKDEDLPKYIGKELSERLIKQEPNKNGDKFLNDLNETIGGEGMKAFYNQIIPTVVDKEVKKFGAKADMIDVNTETPYTEVSSGKEIKPSVSVHHIPITDQMRASALQGLPMFQVESPVTAKFAGERLAYMTTEQIVKTAKVLSDLKSRTRAKINIIDTHEKLPEFIKRQLKPGERPKGVNYGDTNYIIIGNMTSPEQAVITFIHEVGIHDGLGNIFLDPEARKAFFEKVVDDIGMDKIRQVVPREELNLRKDLLGEEFMAYLVDKKINGETLSLPEKTIWQKFIDAVNEVLRKLGLNVKITESDILTIARKAIESNIQVRQADTAIGRAANQNIQPQRTESSDTQRPDKTGVRFAGELLGEPRKQLTTQTETPEFKAWFGNSKVVDENGKPLVVYHGTNADFDIFKEGKENGIFFTESKNIAEGYAVYVKGGALRIGGINETPSIMPVYLSIQNPKIIDFHQTGIASKLKPRIELAKKQGHDGLILKNASDFRDPIGTFNQYIVFSPTQIKSATGNIGTFDPNNPDIRKQVPTTPQFAGEHLQQAGDIYAEQKKTKLNWNERIDKIREFWQDLNLSIRRFQEAVIKKGGKLSDNANPYRDINLAFGRQEKLYKDFTDEKMKPVVSSIAKIIKTGKVRGIDVLPYIICKHAVENNRVLRDREYNDWLERKNASRASEQDEYFKENPNLTEGQKDEWKENKRLQYQEENRKFIEIIADKDYSGVTPFDPENKFKSPGELAKTITDEFETKVDRNLINELWVNMRKATSNILDIWVKGQQISEKQRDDYLKQFQYFVPLRGWREGASKELIYTHGEGFSRSLMHRQGRKSLAENPLAYMQNVAFKAIGEQVDNEVKNSMLNFIFQNIKSDLKDMVAIKKQYYVKVVLPDGSYEWEPVLEKPPKELFDSGDAKMKIYNEHERLRAPRQAREHEVLVHRDKDDVVIVFKDKHLTVAQALNKQNYMYTSLFGKIADARDLNNIATKTGMAAMNNFIKAALTSWNIVFPFTNFFRDAQESAITQLIKGEAGHNVIKNYTRSFPALLRYMRSKPNYKNPDDVELRDFYLLGGATGYTHLKTPEEIEKDLNREIKRMLQSGNLWGDFKNAGADFLKAIEYWNRLFEDATRSSVYLTSRDLGKSKKDANSDAKEASVNFNRKGKSSKAFDSLYAFWNVSLQSLQKNTKLAKDFPGRFSAVAGSFVALGFIEAMLNYYAGDDDNDKENDYYNISPYMRQNYLLIKAGKKYISIPLPQFWRGFKSFGSLVFDVMIGKSEIDNAISQAFINFATSLTPIDIGGFWKTGEFSVAPLVPTVFKPIFEVAVSNRDYMGYTISKEPFTKEQEKLLADSGLGKENVSPAIKLFTDMLFRWGGGDNTTKYFVDKYNKERKVPGFLDINPSYIEHLIKGYTGGTGAVISDLITIAMQVIDPDEGVDFRNIPFVNKFVRQIPESKWATIKEYYSLQDDIRVYKALKTEYKKQEEKGEEQYNRIMNDEYNQQYQQIFEYHDNKLKNMTERIDFDDKEASKVIYDEMQRCIDEINELKEKYNEK